MLQAKKKFGQNFLINENIKNKVAQKVGEQIQQYPNTKNIIEIGPGKGDISRLLLDFHLPLTCLEIDPEAITYLNTLAWLKEALAKKELTLVYCDALKEFEVVDSKIIPSKDYILFSSLPYNVGSRILVNMGLNYPHIPFCVIVQKEVADKTRLKGNKITFFGLWLNLFWDCTNSFDIAGGNFAPAPKVTSTLLIGHPKKELPEFLDTLEKRNKILDIAHKILQYPNKTLLNNLKNFNYTANQAWDIMQEMGFESKNTRLDKDNFYFIIEFLSKKLD
jgi:16S rRNA (adenine1518-N6/adenine1519-N6)-dimethyltransferase